LSSQKSQLFHDKFTQFDFYRKLPYEAKLEKSSEVIKRNLEEFKGRIAVSCSFGKDSVVMLHLALRFDPRVLVVFQNTGVEFPETLAFKDRLKEEWDLNLVELKPVKTFWQCVREYGLPHFRWWRSRPPSRATAEVRPKKKSGTPRCCYWLKERQANLYYRENGIEAIFLGLTFDESYQRRYWIIRAGLEYHMKKRNLKRIYPIAYWTSSDVWRYIKENDLPYNPLYDMGHDRVGCMPCTGFIGWQKQMARANPKLYEKIQEMMGQRLFDYYLRTRVEPCRDRG